MTAIACAKLEANARIASGKENYVSYTVDKVRGADADAVA